MNSLAEILREAKPLYAECQSIINDLAKGGEKSQVATCATEQALLPGTSRRPQPGDGNRLRVSRAKDLPQPESGAQESGNPESEANRSRPVVLGPPYLTTADPLAESRTTVQKAGTSGHGSSANGSQRVEGGAKHSDAQSEDGTGKETTGVAPDSKVAAAHWPEPVLPSTPVIESGASESPTRPQRAGASRAPKPRIIPDFAESRPVSQVLLARYDRGKLYEKVWTLAMQQVAKEYGVSDVAIGKTCRKLYIPVPGKGYWNKKAANQPVEPRPPLPVIQTRSQPSEGRPQQAVTKTASAGLPKAAPLKPQHPIDTGRNQHPPAHRAVINRAPKPRTISTCEEPLRVSPVLLARYDRKKLYDKVWAMPVRLAAREYGVSNVAIAKTCRKLHVPVPGRGYWAKKAANRPVEPRPPLPHLPA